MSDARRHRDAADVAAGGGDRGPRGPAPSRGSAPTPAAGSARAWLAWWVVCAALWLALVDRPAAAELAAGVVAAAIGASGAVLVRRRRQRLTRPRAGLALDALRAARGLIGDLPLLVRVLWRRGLVRDGAHGAVVAEPFAATAADPTAAAERVAAQVLGSLAPSAVVIDVDVERGRLLVHRLEGEP